MTNRIELDLTSENNERYVVLITALEEHAASLEHQADNEDNSDTYNGRETGGPRATDFRRSAGVARQFIEEIEQQLDSPSE